MAFKEAGNSSESPLEVSSGLPARWDRLKEYQCPKCGDQLASFDHIRMHKCACGFKIGFDRFDALVTSLYAGAPTSRDGYRYGNYDDENPF